MLWTLYDVVHIVVEQPGRREISESPLRMPFAALVIPLIRLLGVLLRGLDGPARWPIYAVDEPNYRIKRARAPGAVAELLNLAEQPQSSTEVHRAGRLVSVRPGSRYEPPELIWGVVPVPVHRFRSVPVTLSSCH